MHMQEGLFLEKQSNCEALSWTLLQAIFVLQLFLSQASLKKKQKKHKKKYNKKNNFLFLQIPTPIFISRLQSIHIQ